jgi:hypothetical protein
MTNQPLEKPLAASALALEAAAAALVGGAAPGAAGVLGAALAHVLAAGCAAAFLARRAARLEVDGRGRGAWLMFATVSVVLPVVGPAALAALLGQVARGRVSVEASLARAPLTALADSEIVPAEVSVGIGRGGLEARLRFDPAPASRIAAVLATRRLHVAADAVRLLRLALRDRQEDVRLLAHALLDDRDRQGFARIEALEQALSAAPAERRGPIRLLLAEALHDLCIDGLVSGELESFTLRRARALIEEAGRASPVAESSSSEPSDGVRTSRDALGRAKLDLPRREFSAALLLGRVLLRQGDARAAGAAFEESRRLGAPPTLLAPHLAEAAFQTRERA